MATENGEVKFWNETEMPAFVAGHKLSTFTTDVNAVLDAMIQREISKVSAKRATRKSMRD